MQTNALFWPVFGLVLAGLFVFGLGYDALAKFLEKRGLERGLVSLLVVGGTAVTILASGFLIGFLPALMVLACFAASGLPMIVGSLVRYVTARAADEKAARDLAQEALHDPSA